MYPIGKAYSKDTHKLETIFAAVVTETAEDDDGFQALSVEVSYCCPQLGTACFGSVESLRSHFKLEAFHSNVSQDVAATGYASDPSRF